MLQSLAGRRATQHRPAVRDLLAEVGGFGEEVVAEGADVSRSDIFDEKMPVEGTNVRGKADFGDDAPAEGANVSGNGGFGESVMVVRWF